MNLLIQRSHIHYEPLRNPDDVSAALQNRGRCSKIVIYFTLLNVRACNISKFQVNFPTLKTLGKDKQTERWNFPKFQSSGNNFLEFEILFLGRKWNCFKFEFHSENKVNCLYKERRRRRLRERFFSGLISKIILKFLGRR